MMNKKEKQQQQQQNPKKGTKGAEKGSNPKQQGNKQAGGKQNKASNNNEASEDMKRDQKLQAVLLADSFSRNFRPITLECPKVLLPLVNIPMIEYTIEFLAQNGVEEIFIFCAWHAEKIEEYINRSRWPKLLSIRCISSAVCSSAGDALRELDSLNIVRSDPFILISGDVVSNVNLKKAIQFHKQKRKEDINNIMTVVLKKVQKTTEAKPILDDLVVALNPKTSQMYIFEDCIEKPNIRIPLELMENINTSELSFCVDLLDCHIDICSPELMLLFSDNFDYQDIRRDFIRNEVCNFALGKHIYSYIIQNEYAARVQDPRTYHSICRDIVTRWVYPLVPDVQLLQDSTRYTQLNRYVYREQGTKVSRSASLTEEVVIGKGTTIGDFSTLTRSVVGRDVTIGNRVTIEDAHIWKGVVIEDDVKIDHAIICDRVVIQKGAVIPRGCIISYGVTVTAGTKLAEFTRLTQNNSEDGNGHEWMPTKDEIEKLNWSEVDATSSAFNGERLIRMGSVACFEEEQWKRNLWEKITLSAEDEEFDEEQENFDGDYDAENPNGYADGLEEEKDLTNDALEDGDDSRDHYDKSFIKNVTEMVTTALKEKHPAESVLMEIKGYKFAQNKSYGEVVQGIVVAFLMIAAGSGPSNANILKSLKEVLTGWGKVLLEKMKQNENEEVDIILAAEDFAVSVNKSFMSIFGYILQVFYDGGAVTDEGVISWATEQRRFIEQHPLISDPSQIERRSLFQNEKVQEFIEWIEDEDEDDDDDEEGDESNGEDADDSDDN